MLKNHIELVRESQRQVLLTWHKPDDEGGYIPVAIEYVAEVDPEMRERIEAVVSRALNVEEYGKTRKAFPGSSAHFLGLPKVLARLGYRTRVF